MRRSLPVLIFEPRSMQVRLLGNYVYQAMLDGVSRDASALDGFARVAAFAISTLSNIGGNRKPFNPILGETVEGSFADASSVFCEQVRHHPPVTAMLVRGADWVAHASTAYKVRVSPNTMRGYQKGTICVDFTERASGRRRRVEWAHPAWKIKGLLAGARWGHYVRRMAVRDAGAGLFMDICFRSAAGFLPGAPREKGRWDEFAGGIYSAAPAEVARIPLDSAQLNALPLSRPLVAGAARLLRPVRGSFHHRAVIGGAVAWRFQQARAEFVARPVAECLPSDWQRRADIACLACGDLKGAQWHKDHLEDAQRADRSLRTRGAHAARRREKWLAKEERHRRKEMKKRRCAADVPAPARGIGQDARN
eukprot:gnl/Chilomastix_cuspidata/2072.p2 GENE.gnl/Chilomastix_cuspidata/2072~~gnl/Chilomastix_cuspidata/2072.p2  ORF type:complete len:365 (+),score=174.72 gnl/Chilomastix_cuspidata/2072:838-1932(+)